MPSKYRVIVNKKQFIKIKQIVQHRWLKVHIQFKNI